MNHKPQDSRCTKRRRNGTPCKAPALAGKDACRHHVGKATAKAKAEGRVVVELRKWGLNGHTELADPGETLLRLVTQSRARCELYGRLLGEAYEAAERLRQAHEAQALVVPEPPEEWTEDGELVAEDPAVQRARADLERIFTTGGVAALIGYRYDADRLGRLYAVDEGIRGLAKLEAEERERCAGFAAKAVSAGLAERQVRLAEQQGAMLFGVMRAVLQRVGVDPGDPVVVDAIATEIRAITEAKGIPA
jgi:hypothetical protein